MIFIDKIFLRVKTFIKMAGMYVTLTTWIDIVHDYHQASKL